MALLQIWCTSSQVQKKFKLDALVAWTQIRSFIKGSVEAVFASRYLTRDEYLNLGEARCRLSSEHREAAFSIFEAYERHAQSEGLWDDIDCVFDALKTQLDPNLWRPTTDRRIFFDKIYVDECQDYTGKEYF